MPKTYRSYSALYDRINKAPDKKLTYIGLAVILCSAGLLVYYAFYGLSAPDESFYITVPYRFMLGDRPFINEWHVSQLTAILQYPFVFLFLKVTGGTEGIILYFRLLFILFQTALSCVMFLKLKSRGFFPSLIAALLFNLYVPVGILSLDYYTLSMLPFAVIALILIFSDNITAPKLALCGTLYACAVLAQPSFAAGYLIWFILTAVFAVIRKQPHKLLTFRSLLWATAGIIPVFIVFCVFIFSKLTPAEFLSALPNIWRNEEYSSKTLLVGFPDFFVYLCKIFSWGLAAMALALILVIIDKQRQQRALIRISGAFIASAVSLVFAVIYAIKQTSSIPLLHLPFIVSYVGIIAYILLRNKDKRLLALWVSGVVYFFLLGLTSEAMAFVGSYGLVLSAVSSVFMICSLCSELIREPDAKKSAKKKTKKNAPRLSPVIMSLLLFMTVLCIHSGLMLSRDLVDFEYDREPLTKTVSVARGPYKGIRISPEEDRVYNDILNDIEFIDSLTDKKYSVFSNNPWHFLASGRLPLNFSLWYMYNGLLLDAYKDYCDYVNEQPEYIYIVNKNLMYDKAGESTRIDNEMEFINSNYDYDMTQLNAGLLIKTRTGDSAE